MPDALSRGDLLYRDVVYWFGPLTPYSQAALFAAAGSGFATLVAWGIALSLACLAALWLAATRVAGRRDAFLWTALAIPALCFMPNAGGSLLGMGYRIWQAALLSLLSLSVAAARRKPGAARLLGAGALAGLAGLCRTEWGLAAAAAVLLLLWHASSDRRRLARRAAAAMGGFAAVFCGGIAIFLFAAGPRAVLEDGHLLFGALPEETRRFLLAFSGIADWRRGLLELAYSAAMWTGAALLIETLADRDDPDALRRRARVLAGLLAALGLTALFGGAAGAVVWSAAPAICAGALVVGLRRTPGPRAAALAAFGFLGLVLSYRRPFHIGDSAYVGPPLLFAFVCAAGLLRVRAARLPNRAARRRVADAFAGALAVAVAAGFAARLLQYRSIEASPVAGTSRMLAARPEAAREIEALALAIRRETPSGGGLVVFPEGELLNFLAGRGNPIRHKLYLPGYLTDGNETEILRELRQAPPAAIVLWRRPTSEYGRGLFGVDYGRKIRAWIDETYRVTPFRAPGAPARSNPAFLLGVRSSGS